MRAPKRTRCLPSLAFAVVLACAPDAGRQGPAPGLSPAALPGSGPVPPCFVPVRVPVVSSPVGPGPPMGPVVLTPLSLEMVFHASLPIPRPPRPMVATHIRDHAWGCPGHQTMLRYRGHTDRQFLAPRMEGCLREAHSRVGESRTPVSSMHTPAASAPEAPRDELGGIIRRCESEHGVDRFLITAVIKVESNFNPHAVSPEGARGLMQLMCSTARDVGVADSLDPIQNVTGGSIYLAQQLRAFDGDLRLALAAYNAGPGAVRRHGGIPPHQETQNFVNKVLYYYGQYSQR